jgi:hypothetical protein
MTRSSGVAPAPWILSRSLLQKRTAPFQAAVLLDAPAVSERDSPLFQRFARAAGLYHQPCQHVTAPRRVWRGRPTVNFVTTTALDLRPERRKCTAEIRRGWKASGARGTSRRMRPPLPIPLYGGIFVDRADSRVLACPWRGFIHIYYLSHVGQPSNSLRAWKRKHRENTRSTRWPTAGGRHHVRARVRCVQVSGSKRPVTNSNRTAAMLPSGARTQWQ